GATDLNGNALAQPFSCGFKTIGPIPAVILSTPTCSSAGVSLNIAITATFNTDLLASTVNGSTVSLTGAGGIGSVSGAVSYDSANRIVIFTPAALLLPSSTYTFTITTGVQSSSGVALQSNLVCSFTTGTVPDTTPPTIISVSPNCNATNVSLNNIVTITFSEALKMSTVNSSTVSLTGPGGHVAGSVTYDASTNSAIFTPSSNLTQNVSYSVAATTGITDLSGNVLAQPLSCSFTTAGPPTVISSTPSCN